MRKKVTKGEIFNQLLRGSSPDSSKLFRLRPREEYGKPWRPGQDLVSLREELAQLIGQLQIRPIETFEQGAEMFFVCLVMGVSLFHEEHIEWRFAGRLRFEREKIDGCAIYADFVSLSRQLGLLAVNSDQPEADPKLQNGQARSHDELRRLSNASRWAFALCDDDGLILESNSFFEKLVDCRSGQAENRTLYDFLNHSFSRIQEGSDLTLERGSNRIWIRTVLHRKLKEAGRTVTFLAFAPSSKIGRALRFLSQERANLSRDLHDGVAQDAAALRLFLLKDSPQDSALLTKVTRRIAEETQTLLHRLEGPTIEFVSLATALQKLSNRYRWEYDFTVTLELNALPDLPTACEIVAYRVIQESLRNVLLHSGVKEARVNVKVEHHTLSGQVIDRGKGFQRQDTSRFGIKGMRERCELLGGAFQIQSQPGRGASVQFQLPLR